MVSSLRQITLTQTTAVRESTGGLEDASIGITLLIVFVGLGLATILTGVVIWCFLIVKDKKISNNGK